MEFVMKAGRVPSRNADVTRNRWDIWKKWWHVNLHKIPGNYPNRPWIMKNIETIHISYLLFTAAKVLKSSLGSWSVRLWLDSPAMSFQIVAKTISTRICRGHIRKTAHKGWAGWGGGKKPNTVPRILGWRVKSNHPCHHDMRTPSIGVKLRKNNDIYIWYT